MRRIENDCMDCAVPAYPCLGDVCRYRHVEHIYCDACGEEVEEEELRKFDDMELCRYCYNKIKRGREDEI